jgi:hypothetical protein
MSYFDDIKKKIQLLKNKKPETDINENLSKIEMEINKETLSLFKKNNEKDRVALLSENTIDNNHTNFASTSLLAQNHSFLQKTIKKDATETMNLLGEREQILITNKEELPRAKKEEINLNDKEHFEVNNHNQINTINEIFCKNSNSEEMIYKNNIINYQALNNLVQNSKNKVGKEYTTNDICSNPPSISSNHEKSSSISKREKFSECKISSNSGSNIKLLEMKKLLDVKLTDREKYYLIKTESQSKRNRAIPKITSVD